MNINNRDIQKNLKYTGRTYYKGPIDGILGEVTVEALKRYQRDNALNASGEWDEATAAKCEESVRAAQKLLNSHGARLRISGVMDAQSVEAAKVFQRRNALKVCGVVNRETLEALRRIPEHARALEKYLSPHFTADEFMCGCEGRYCTGYPAEIKDSLIRVLETLRHEINDRYPLGNGHEHTVIIKEGLRCAFYAKERGESFGAYLSDGSAAYISAGGLAQKTLNEVIYSIGIHVVHKAFDRTLISVKGAR